MLVLSEILGYDCYNALVIIYVYLIIATAPTVAQVTGNGTIHTFEDTQERFVFQFYVQYLMNCSCKGNCQKILYACHCSLLS